MQRLYSTFAGGWPGVGLLLLRTVAAIALVNFGIIHLVDPTFSSSMIPFIIGSCAGMLLLLGLWTPVVGTLLAIVELWIASTYFSDRSISIILACISGSLAMLGPGAFSLDARLFGRRHLQV